MAFFSKGGANSGAFLLDDGSLICNCLGRPDISNELLDCAGVLVSMLCCPQSQCVGNSDVRELIVGAATPYGV